MRWLAWLTLWVGVAAGHARAESGPERAGTERAEPGAGPADAVCLRNWTYFPTGPEMLSEQGTADGWNVRRTERQANGPSGERNAGRNVRRSNVGRDVGADEMFDGCWLIVGRASHGIGWTLDGLSTSLDTLLRISDSENNSEQSKNCWT